MVSPAARLASIGANTRRLRIKLGLTQEKLAELIDQSPRQIQLLEAGVANPVALTLIKLADTLGVRPGDLFRIAPVPERREGRPKKKLNPSPRRRS